MFLDLAVSLAPPPLSTLRGMGSLMQLGIGVGVALGVGILTVLGLKMFLGKKKKQPVTLEMSNVNYPLQLVDRVCPRSSGRELQSTPVLTAPPI